MSARARARARVRSLVHFRPSFASAQRNICLGARRRAMIYGGIIRTQLPFQ